jgi:drug/metabolite transporter (DMT)-like permease
LRSKLYELRADLLLLSVAIAWGVTFLMVQDAINSTPVYAFLFFRFGIASILMFFIAYKYLNQINKRTIFYGVILGTFLFSAFATQTFGLLYTKSSIVAFITGLNVIFVPFLAYFWFLKIIYQKKFSLLAIVAVIGLIFTYYVWNFTIGIGEFLTLICAFYLLLQIIFTGKFSKEVNVFLLVLFQLITVTILSLIFSLSLDDVTFNLSYDYAFFKAVLITAIFATVYAFLIQTYMQQFTTATKTAIIFAMEPVSAAIFAYFMISETLTSIQLSGAVLIVLATIIAEVKFKRKLKHTL